MRLTILVLALLAGFGSPALGADKGATRTEVDEAVDRGLAFLQRQQDRSDGSWGAQPTTNPALTGLAVMAFLSAGHVPGEGRYGETIEKGVRWALKQQRANGLIASEGGYEMYQHGICTLMLAEVAGVAEGKLAEEVRQKLPRAIAVILKAQRRKGAQKGHEGGWRYHVNPLNDSNTSDVSVTGWQLLALRAAKDLGCDVPPESIDDAVAFLKRCHDARTGGFDYHPGSQPTSACTGVCILGLELCGKGKGHAEEAIKGGNYLLNRPPRWGQSGEGHFFYSIYYCSQAMFQLGDNYWDHFRPQLHGALLANQKKDSGGWFGGDRDGQQLGPIYGTSMAILALTVEYRYLPIYQRGEEPRKRTGVK